jgi:hypothetical protein
LATDQSVGDGDFIGLGTSQGGTIGFVRDNVVISQNSTITGLVLNIRDKALAVGDTVTATIFRSTDGGVTFTSTGITTTVTGPNPPNFANATTGSVAVNQFDLLSVQITFPVGVGSLADGVAATITLSSP